MFRVPDRNLEFIKAIFSASPLVQATHHAVNKIHVDSHAWTGLEGSAAGAGDVGLLQGHISRAWAL